MSRNPYGIFASVVSGRHNHGLTRLRSLVTTTAQAETLLAAVVLAVAGQMGRDCAEVEADIREGAAGCQVPRVRADVRLVWAALCEIDHAFTTVHRQEGAGEGFESPNPIHDSRAASDIAEMLLLSVCA